MVTEQPCYSYWAIKGQEVKIIFKRRLAGLVFLVAAAFPCAAQEQAGPFPPEACVEMAVSQMAMAVKDRITIAVGRIGYNDTQTVSTLSAWLKKSIIYYSGEHHDKFQVASDVDSAALALASRGLTVEAHTGENPIQAIVTGSFSPLEDGAAVLLQLISTGGGKEVLASAQFTVSGTELERRKLSLLPENDISMNTAKEFEEKLSAIGPYAGAANQWAFAITPDVLDGLYYEGDLMSMQVYSDRDCFFRIIHVDVNGNTQVIYPVGEKDNNFISAGETRNIPDNFLYLMGAPFGEELILAAAYDQPFKTGFLSKAAPFSAEVITRSLAVESDAGNEPVNPGATAAFSYTVLPRF